MAWFDRSLASLRDGMTRQLVALGAIILGVGLVILAMIVWGGRNGDDVAIRRASFVIQTGIDAVVTRGAREHLAAWDVARARPLGGADDVARVLIDTFAHDVARTRRHGEDAPRAFLAPHLDAVALAAAQSTFTRLDAPAAALPADNARRRAFDGPDFGRASGIAIDAALISHEGRPAVAVRSRRVMDGAVVMSIAGLDAAFLMALTRDYAVDEPRLSAIDDSRWPETSMPLVSDAGEPIGHFIWSPKRAGTQILERVLPIVGPGLLIVFGLAAWLILGMARRNTSVAASEAHARFLALHDELTGLPNRRAFTKLLDAETGRIGNGSKGLALALIDVDHFKDVNDTLGHPAGDALVRALGERIRAAIGDLGTIARLGGDEFAILAPGLADPAAAHALARKVCATFAEAFDLDGQKVHVTTSAGIAITTEIGIDPATLVRKADVALNRAKADGRGRYVMFSEEMDEAVRLRRNLEVELREAIARDELELHYQLLMHHDGRIPVGVEALARWRHPTKGMISPAVFLPVAEESGLVVDLGFWVIRRAFLDARRLGDLTVAVNLSAMQLRYPEFLSHLDWIIDETEIDPKRIEFEITESVLIDENGRSRAILAALRQRGFRIALDDFGTGYSSLSYLRRFEVNKIKIDRSFVINVESSVEAAAIVHAVVGLARALGLGVTAEGVETIGQHRFLQGAGCDQMQGFLFARAEPVADIEARLYALEGARAKAA